MGFTNIVGRPSRNGAELSKQEMDDGVEALHEKARRWRPECMCIVGKSIWESIWRVRHGGKAVGKNFRYGWQDESQNMGVIEGEWKGARVFVASSWASGSSNEERIAGLSMKNDECDYLDQSLSEWTLPQANSGTP
jgi:mismatch-specific thymine-DNA glycosylase